MTRFGKSASSKPYKRFQTRIKKCGTKLELETVGAELRRFLTNSRSTDELAAMSVAELTSLRSLYTERHLELGRPRGTKIKGKNGTKGRAKTTGVGAKATEHKEASTDGAGADGHNDGDAAAEVAAELEASASCDVWWNEVGSRSLRTMGYRQSRRKGLSHGLQNLGGRNKTDFSPDSGSGSDWLSIRSSRSLPATAEGWAELADSLDADGADGACSAIDGKFGGFELTDRSADIENDDGDLIGVDDELDLSLFEEASPPPPPPRPSCHSSLLRAPEPEGHDPITGLLPPGHSTGNPPARPPASPGQRRRHQHRAAAAAGKQHNAGFDGAEEMFRAARRATLQAHLAPAPVGQNGGGAAKAKSSSELTAPTPPPRSPAPPPRKPLGLPGLGVTAARSG